MLQHSLGMMLFAKSFGEDLGSMVGTEVGINVGLVVGKGVGSGVRARTTATPINVTPINSSFWIRAKNPSSSIALDTWVLSVSSTESGYSSSGVSLYSIVVIIMYFKMASFLVVLL